MKIWAQSGGTVSQGNFAEYGKALVDYLKEAGRPGTTVDVHGVEETAPGIDNYHFAAQLTTGQVVRNALRAEEQGYDAFLVVNTLDLGYYEIRELTKIPAVFITEASVLLARQLAPRFAFFTHSETMLRRVEELAHLYDLDDRMVPGASLGITYNDFPDLYAHPAKYLPRLRENAHKLVASGADILIPAGNPFNLFMVREGVREIEGAPIMDVCAASVATAEMLVDLKAKGVTRSRHGAFTPANPEQVAIARRRYEA